VHAHKVMLTDVDKGGECLSDFLFWMAFEAWRPS
jgi:hypothetical protein